MSIGRVMRDPAVETVPARAVSGRGRQICDRLKPVGGLGVRIHHLNCGSLRPRGGRLFGGAGGPLSPAPMCCHCLLIEGDDRLILVDAGLGVEDVNEPRRLGFLFNAMVRPRLDVAETALRQVADLGFRPSDVRHIVPTHLDLDHAGGICDFPDAAVHVFAAELRAASHRSTLTERSRYRAVQIAAVKKWAPVEEDGESWFGFSAVRAIPGTHDDVLLVPLPGHSRGHCGVAVRRADDWLLHCGDAYFHHSEVDRTATPRRRDCAGWSRGWSSTARSDAPIRPACANSRV
jgi:glyoxylase-like metal-dependent hydrolase (beta-lactamase superfamily II)